MVATSAAAPPANSLESQRYSRRDARRRAFLDAAMQLFMEKGYGATSLHDVVSRSGGSLSTLYEMFGNKAGLFRELIEDKCATVSSMFDDAAIADVPLEPADCRRAAESGTGHDVL